MTHGPGKAPEGSAGGSPLDLSQGVSPELLDAFLDGLLSPDQALAVGRALESEASSKSILQLQQGIDRVLRAQFCGPGDIQLNLPATGSLREARSKSVSGEQRTSFEFPAAASQVDTRSLRFRRTITRIAAMLFLTIGILWGTGVIDTGMFGLTPSGLMDPTPVYDKKVAAGFVPDWVCSNPEEFAGVTQLAFGQSLQMASWPGVEVVGWSYYDAVLSGDTHQLLVKVNGKPVLVFIDLKEKARRLRAPAGSGLSIHKRVLGKLVMYEMTPNSLPDVLGLLYDPTLGGPPDTGCAEIKK